MKLDWYDTVNIASSMLDSLCLFVPERFSTVKTFCNQSVSVQCYFPIEMN